jgi:hypothetical protein
MLMRSADGAERYIHIRRRHRRIERDERARRVLRDRVILLLVKCGLTLADVADVAKAFAEGSKDRGHLGRRLKLARRYADWEAQRLLDADD